MSRHPASRRRHDDLSHAQPAPFTRVVMVYDVADPDAPGFYVTAQEAAAGMIRYARSLGPGTPACGEAERQALELLRGN